MVKYSNVILCKNCFAHRVLHNKSKKEWKNLYRELKNQVKGISQRQYSKINLFGLNAFKSPVKFNSSGLIT